MAKPKPEILNPELADREVVRRQEKDRLRAPLKIRTREVPEELRSKWYGMPPTAAKEYATPRTDTVAF